jgi:exopolysaccharide production protein ExoQ
MTQQGTHSPTGFERFVIVGSFLLLAGFQAGFLGDQPIGEPTGADVTRISEEGDERKQILLLGVYAMNLGLLAWRIKPRALLLTGLPILALTAWSFLTITWSVLPDPTLRRNIALLGTIAVGVLAGLRLDADELGTTLVYAAAITIVTTLAFTVAFPGLGLDVHGQLRGPFAHKNTLGGFAATAALVVGYTVINHWATASPRIRRRNILVFFGCITCLILSRSGTPLLAMALGVLACALTWQLVDSDGLTRSLTPAFLAVFAGVLAISVSELGSILTELLGRDATFSGRTTIWQFVMAMIAERPALGYGYGIFWLGEGAPAGVFWYWTKQIELHAHNGYLQLVLDVGFVGAALFACSLLVLLARTVRLGAWGDRSTSGLVALLLGFFIMTNIAETRLWQSNELLTTLYIWSIVRVNVEVFLRNRTLN